MKKIIQVLFIIIFAILLSGAVVYSKFIELQEGETDRGVSVKLSYSGDASWRR